MGFDDEGKIRKALVSISIFTLIISNLELASNELDFFGLKIVVSIGKISAVFRLSTWLLLSGLILVLMEHSPNRTIRVLRVRDEKW